jgi:hypothetical protein
MKSEIRLKDLLTVDQTDGSYEYDPLDIMITAYKKRKKASMVSEENPEVEESVFDTMSKHELHAELLRLDRDIKKLNSQSETPTSKSNLKILKTSRDFIMSLLKEDTSELTEVLTAQQRMARRAAIRKNKSRLRVGRRAASRRRASNTVLKARAMRAARNELAKRLTGGKSKGELSYAARANVERQLARKKGIIKSLAARLISQVRTKENQRLKNKNKR